MISRFKNIKRIIGFKEHISQLYQSAQQYNPQVNSDDG